MSTLQDRLQIEFCPPLDPALIAAIVADYVFDDDPQTEKPPDGVLQDIRALLSELAAQAETQIEDEDAVSENLASMQLASHSVTDDTFSSCELFSFDGTMTTTTATSSTATSSTASDAPSQPFSSPLGFLQAAFPAVATSKLKKALGTDWENGNIDMELVIERLLTNEYIHELEERGLDALAEVAADDAADWHTFSTKKKEATLQKQTKKSNKRGTTVSLVDVRQRQHIRTPSAPRITSPDPWTQLSSVATYLSTLLPTHPASYFQSAFHSPDHPSPSKAVRSALLTIARQFSSNWNQTEPSAEEGPLLFTMLDILSSSPLYFTLNSEERDQFIADALLALRATNQQPDTALDIVWLLRDLDSDFASGNLDWGIYHLPASPIASSHKTKASLSPRATKLPQGPPSPPPPPLPRFRHQAQSSSPNNAWRTVPQRKSSQGPHPLADFIPAYNPANGERRARGGGNALGKGGKGDVGELSRGDSTQSHRLRAKELIRQRNVALMEAGRMWQRGNAKSRGGEVALHFAERARELQQQARQEQLDAARGMVYARRVEAKSSDTIDLHGTTVMEAIQIVKEMLYENGASAARPLKIVTGKGSHSINGVGVLGPAIKKALVEDGWSVGTWDAGLVVRDRIAWAS